MAYSISGAFTEEKTDELYTPKCLVEIIIPYLQQKNLKSIWCPFDTKNSEFVLTLKESSFIVQYSHINNGQDFFTYLPPNSFDAVVSNPPFSLKLKVFKRLNQLQKPWAMICNIMCLNYMEIGNYFADHPVQLLIPDKRVSFNGNPSSFNSGYFCSRLLEKDLIFVHMKNCNSKNDYIPSRMYESFPRKKVLGSTY